VVTINHKYKRLGVFLSGGSKPPLLGDDLWSCIKGVDRSSGWRKTILIRWLLRGWWGGASWGDGGWETLWRKGADGSFEVYRIKMGMGCC